MRTLPRAGEATLSRHPRESGDPEIMEHRRRGTGFPLEFTPDLIRGGNDVGETER